MERLWSYLGKFSKITKEMTPENRTDLLVDGLLHYGRKIRDKFGEFILIAYLLTLSSPFFLVHYNI